MLGALAAKFLPEDQVVAFAAEVLAWYKEKAEGKGRIRIGELMREVGTDGLQRRLKAKFPEFTIDKITPPTPVNTEIGEGNGEK